MRAVTNIKLKDVKELYTQDLSCIKKVSSPYTILLHPMYLADTKNGVKIELNSMLKNYSKQLKGIVLGFDNVKIYPHGQCFGTNPFVHVSIMADFYVFSPEIGSILKGNVVKKSPNHVGCLVHKIFNASSSIPNGITRENWCGNSVREGDYLEMKITELNLTCAVPFLKGDIIPESIRCFLSKNLSEIKVNEEKAEDEDSGISGIEKPNDEDIESDSGKKKKKKKKNYSTLDYSGMESNETPKKDRKRKRDSLENSNEEEDSKEIIEKQKKKKRKFEDISEYLSDENNEEDMKRKKKKRIKEENL